MEAEQRLGAFDTAELDRLLWETKELFEWNAFIRAIEELPLVRAFQRRWRTSTRYHSERWVRGFLAENRAFRRYVLREIAERGPLLSRELEDRAKGDPRDHRWWGSRRVGLMLESLDLYGEIAVAGRREGQRLWDLAERWHPKTDALSVKAGFLKRRRRLVPADTIDAIDGRSGVIGLRVERESIRSFL